MARASHASGVVVENGFSFSRTQKPLAHIYFDCSATVAKRLLWPATGTTPGFEAPLDKATTSFLDACADMGFEVT